MKRSLVVTLIALGAGSALAVGLYEHKHCKNNPDERGCKSSGGGHGGGGGGWGSASSSSGTSSGSSEGAHVASVRGGFGGSAAGHGGGSGA